MDVKEFSRNITISVSLFVFCLVIVGVGAWYVSDVHTRFQLQNDKIQSNTEDIVEDKSYLYKRIDIKHDRQALSIKELEELLSEFSELTEVSIDTETTSLNQLDAELVGVSLSARGGSGYYVPLGHSNGKNLDRAKALKALGKILLNEVVGKTGQNIKYDLHVFKNAGLDVANIGFDTMLAAYIVDPTARKYSLDHLALERCGYQMQPISDLIGSGTGV